jgi:hypothetical protein
MIDSQERSAEVYCFVLDPPLPAIVNGIQCATWGHNLQDEVVKHPYYGSQDVIEDLKIFKGWEHGFIEVQNSVTKHLVKILKAERQSNSKIEASI